jgi:hypothetical protein
MEQDKESIENQGTAENTASETSINDGQDLQRTLT